MFSLDFGAFIFLFGLLWQQKAATPPDENADDPEKAQKDYRNAQRRQATFGLFRLLMILLGAITLVYHLVASAGPLDDLGGFATLLGLYGLLLLMVQRSEPNRRIATLLILALTAFIVGRYGDYRGWQSEGNWAIYAALVVNYVFWLAIGRRYPPASSEEIKVWGMDEQFG